MRVFSLDYKLEFLYDTCPIYLVRRQASEKILKELYYRVDVRPSFSEDPTHFLA